jgi:hypothetical protein
MYRMQSIAGCDRLTALIMEGSGSRAL